jgi:hypothetical protein
MGGGMSAPYIGPNARVCGSAQVYGSAWVYGSALVYGSAEVYGSAQVCGSALVCGDGRIAKTRDYLVLGPSIGESHRYITAHRDAKIGIRVNAGCFSGTVAEFRSAVSETHAENYAQRTQYELFADLIEAHFALADLMDAEEAAEVMA